MKKVDLEIGTKYNKLTVVGPVRGDRGQRMWLCKCECGGTGRFTAWNLRTGTNIQCAGRKHKIEGASRRIVNLSNKRFGKLTVTTYAGSSKWNCVCECGVEKIVDSYQLQKLKTTTCDQGSCRIPRSVSHGKSSTVEYRTWSHMKARCYNPNNKDWKYYGERGISVCERWLNSFENFLEDMGEKPDPNLSIDRIDPDGNYEPSNCRWADDFTQSQNQRRHKKALPKTA